MHLLTYEGATDTLAKANLILFNLRFSSPRSSAREDTRVLPLKNKTLVDLYSIN